MTFQFCSSSSDPVSAAQFSMPHLYRPFPPGIRSVEIEDVTATLDVALTWHQDNLSPLAGRFIDVARRIVSAS